MSDILRRRSVRKFNLEKKISYETLTELCKYAESAPTARRQNSRSYIIIDDENIISKMAPIAKGTMLLQECNTVIAVIGVAKDKITTPLMQTQDLSAAVENILIHATELNLGSCWLGVYPHEDRIKPLNDILGVNDGSFVFALVALGYPKDENALYDSLKYNNIKISHNKF